MELHANECHGILMSLVSFFWQETCLKTFRCNHCFFTTVQRLAGQGAAPGLKHFFWTNLGAPAPKGKGPSSLQRLWRMIFLFGARKTPASHISHEVLKSVSVSYTIMYSTNDNESHFQEAKQQSERIFLCCQFVGLLVYGTMQLALRISPGAWPL